MKSSAIREMGVEELQHKETELREQLFRLRVQKSLGQLDSPMKVKNVKRDIARVVTILKQKQVSQ